MASKFAYAALFGAFALPALVLQWPAAWLEGRLEQASGGRWRMNGAQGTIWNGGATLLLAENGTNGESLGDAGRWRAVQNVHWQVRWRDLWSGRLTFDAALEQGALTVSIDRHDVIVEKLDSQLPAMVLGGLVSGPVGRYGWQGMVRAHTLSFRCSHTGRGCGGEVELMWKDAGVSEIPGPILGSYRIRIFGEGPSTHFDLSTVEGRLQLKGHGEIGAGGMSFSGEAASTGADAGRLDAQLRTLGRSAGVPGKYIIEYRESGPG